MKEYMGSYKGEGMHFAIVVSRFNEFVTKNLVAGAIDGLKRHGVKESNISLYWVPGAFEIPLVAKKAAESGKFHAVLCLGLLIKGATKHFDYVAAQSTAGIARVSLDTGIPLVYEVLTTNTIEEAIERAGTKAGNKGFEAAMCALEMADLMKSF